MVELKWIKKEKGIERLTEVFEKSGTPTYSTLLQHIMDIQT